MRCSHFEIIFLDPQEDMHFPGTPIFVLQDLYTICLVLVGMDGRCILEDLISKWAESVTVNIIVLRKLIHIYVRILF